MEVVRLKEHVRKLGVRNSVIAILEASSHGFFRDHVINREVLPDIAEEVEILDAAEPVVVIQELRGIRSAEVEETFDYAAYAGEISSRAEHRPLISALGL